MKLKLILTTIILSFAIQLLYAQQEVNILGKVVDVNSGQLVEFATVVIGNKETQKPITGTTTGLDGTFNIKTTAKDFYVEVSFIGFVPTKIEEFTIEKGKIDLGTIQISENKKVLGEVTVRAEKSQTEFKLDKRVFNVGKDLSSTGASALEVLNNVPSVNVSIEGEVSLRGSTGVQILINGKPSVLTSEQGGNGLGTITADMIEKVEVITNPSAKYDAEGTSGIINIVIKKEDRRGTNGSITFNTGTPHNHSVGLSLNRRTEVFNLFSQFGVGYRELPNDVTNINRDLVNNNTVFTEGEEFRNETFYNVILGTDIHLNELNVITVSGNFAYEVEDQPSETRFNLENALGEMESEWRRTEVTEATNPKWQYEVQYKREFKDNEDHTFLISAIGSFFGKDQSSDFLDETISGADNDSEQKTRTNFQEAENTLKLDYTKPLNDNWTFETGTQYVLNDVSNDFAVSDLVEGQFVNNPNLTNIFEYHQNVLGVYGTGAYEGDKWGIKFGLRVENTDLSTLLVTTDEANDQNFTNLFPSLHTSYKVSKNYSIQAGYSRRIFRPRLWDLNPFFNIRNNFSVRTGNPDLLPEFTDSYEIASIYDAGKTSWNFAVYHRYTTDVVERISTFENNVNTFKPFNIGTNRSTGLEINFKYDPVKWMAINGDFNYNYFNREGTLEATSFDFSADQWSSKVTSKFKLPAGIDFEVITQYRSKFQTVQGEVADVIFADMGLRKKVMKGRGVFNFSVRDIFASRIRESETIQPNFYLFNERYRGRFITLGFSYGFGKGEAMEFSGRKRF